MEELDSQLSRLLEKALDAAEKTGDFVIEQAPDLLQQFYNWHIALNSMGVLLGVILITLGFNLRKIWGKKVSKDYDKGWDEIVFNGYASEEISTILTMLIFNLAGVIISLISIYYLVFILVAPKVYLIEYFIKH